MKSLAPKSQGKLFATVSRARLQAPAKKLPSLAELKRQLAAGSADSAKIARASTRKLTGKDIL
jgi:hypothetical protein